MGAITACLAPVWIGLAVWLIDPGAVSAARVWLDAAAAVAEYESLLARALVDDQQVLAPPLAHLNATIETRSEGHPSDPVLEAELRAEMQRATMVLQVAMAVLPLFPRLERNGRPPGSGAVERAPRAQHLWEPRGLRGTWCCALCA